MADEKITRAKAAMMVAAYEGGKIFTVTFVKRGDGSTRVMNCRKGVKKHSRGGVLKFDPKKKGLVSVFDMQIEQYRMISLENIKKIAMGGKTYIVK
jgi:hypothetical protein